MTYGQKWLINKKPGCNGQDTVNWMRPAVLKSHDQIFKVLKVHGKGNSLLVNKHGELRQEAMTTGKSYGND